MGAWTVCKFKSRVNEKEGVVVNFFGGGGGVDMPMHTRIDRG